nr:glycosyltransferase family 4 protein [Aeromicrobium stalagmiti]
MLVHSRPTRGGFSAVVSQAAELTALGGFEVSVLVQDGDRVKELPPTVDHVVLTRPLASLRGLIQARRAIAKSRPQILHLHGRQAGFLLRLLGPRNQVGTVLYTPHGTPWSGGSTRGFLMTEISERILLRRTDSVLCVSRAEQADWTRRDGSPRIVFFPNLVLASVSIPPVADPVPALNSTVLVPGGYNPQKRLEVVIEALALTSAPRRPVLFCGSVDDPAYRDRLIELARLRGVESNVTFAQSIPGITSMMHHAHLVVLPSYSEGMPIVGQEAILAGANVLWSSIPPHHELFADSGGSFWTAEELAQLLEKQSQTFSVTERQGWLEAFQLDARGRREAFWVGLRSRHG